MSDWKTIRLGDSATFLNGFPFKPSDWGNTGLPIIRIQNLTESRNEINYYDGRISNKYIVKNGDVLISWSASLGAYIWNKGDAVLNQHIFKVVFNKIEFNSKFFKYLVDGKISEMINDTHGSTMKHITKSKFDNILIQYPPIDIQNRIANTLDMIYRLIDLRKRQIEKMDLLIKSQFIEMFGDPKNNPKEWTRTTIGDTCYYVKDGPHVSPSYVEEGNGVPFISTRNLVGGGIDWSSAKHISESDYEIYIKKCKPVKGDILYTKGGTTGIAKFVDTNIKFANWVHVAVLKFGDDLDGLFFQYMLNSDYCYQQSQLLTKGIANRDLVLSSMKQIKFYIPPIELQRKFSSFVQQVDKSKFIMGQTVERRHEQHLYTAVLTLDSFAINLSR